MSFLYVSEQGTYVRIEEGSVVAQKPDGSKTLIPIETLEGVVLFGQASISSRCSAELLKRGLPVTYLSGSGSFYGRLESTRHVNIKRQREQFRRGDDEEFCLKFAANAISAKIHNQTVLLRRYARSKGTHELDDKISHISELERKIERAASIEQIMGYEGAVSKAYFETLSMLARKEFKFKGRSKMPPLDPFNSLLSLGYTLLLYEMYTAIANRGLNPYAGFMHKDKNGHPALASDMIEEWRAVIVDSLVMNVVQNYIIDIDDFYTDEKTKGIYIKKPAIKKFVTHFEQKIRAEAGYLPYVDYPISFRKAIQFQTMALAKAVEEKDASIYNSVRIR